MRFRKPQMKHFLRSKTKVFALLAVAVGYVMMVDTNLQQRALTISDHEEMARELFTIDLGNGDCDIGSPTENANPAPPEATKTLLASYPGSGKRFTWTVIKALTNHEIADDWNFSEKMDSSPLMVKTSWPHKEGTWSWGKQMDQVLLLVRNPRWAIPSYHNMRWELDYAPDWASSYIRIPNTYTDRPAVEQWETWRDGHFNTEMNRWSSFIEFWMQGGFQEATNKTHDRCVYSEIDCSPKAVIDFDHFYQENPTNDFAKIGDVLEASDNVDLVSAQARVCVLDSVFDRSELHQANRLKPELRTQYKFTMPQLDRMLNYTLELKEKFSEPPFDTEDLAIELVRILDTYIPDLVAEYQLEVEIYLEEFLVDELGTFACSDLTGSDSDVCTFMKAPRNHDAFFDSDYPENFSYDQWLTERSILTRMYYENGGSSWTDNTGWVGGGDHCTTWFGVTCDENSHVTELVMNGNQVSGVYPSELSRLGQLTDLNLSSNALTGEIPQDVCDASGLTIVGDATNCPNAAGEEGCCDTVV